MTTALSNPPEPSSLRVCPQCGTETVAPICKKDGFTTVERGRHFSRAAADRVGLTLNARWRLDEVLRIDLLAVVYRGWDVRVGREVAVRVLAAEIGTTLDRIARFQREGRFLASLAHPNIVQVYEHGVTNDGTLFIAEEMIRGESLQTTLTRGALPVEDVVAIGRELFDALAEAHAHGVQHRSLSLGNLWRIGRGDQSTIKIDGFGWVRVLADEHQGFTYPRELAHAHATMAPEQARGRGVSGHADLYSAGAILYGLLTGAPPFGDGSPSDLLVAHAVKMPRVPERDGVQLHGPLVDLILRCLEKKPWNRPDGGSAALEVLEAGAARPLAPSPTRLTLLQPLPAPKQPPQATVELRGERTALPAAIRNATIPVVVKTVATAAVPTQRLPSEERTVAEAFEPPARSHWGIWVLALLFAAAVGVVIALLSSNTNPVVRESAHSTPPTAPAPTSEPATRASVGSEATAPSAPAPSEPAKLVEAKPAEPVKTVPSDVPAIAPVPVDKPLIASVEPTKDTVEKGAPAKKVEKVEKVEKVAPKPKDPFADLEDPTAGHAGAAVPVVRRVLVDSEPAGASVMVDGRAVGATPIYIEWDEVGRPVAVRVAKPGFKAALATLGPKTKASVFLTLQPADGL